MASQFEREIEDLLKNLGDLEPKESSWERFRRTVALRWRRFWHTLRDLPHLVPADQLMLAAILFLVSAYFLRFVLPSIARLVGLTGLALFFAAFVFSFNQLIGAHRRDIRWRGQSVDLSSGRLSLVDRLILWLRRKLRGY